MVYRRSWFVVLIALVVTLPALLGACCATINRPRPTHYHAEPLARLKLHADVNFTPLERGLIDQACRDILLQTGGWVQIDLEYDLDFSDVEVLKAGNILVRQPEFSMLILMADAKYGGHLLGLTVSESHQTFLVADRLTTPAMWRHVVMHELLHSVGLDDIRNPRDRDALMYWATEGAEPTTCMHKADARELCRVLFCDAERVNYCDR